MVTRTINTYKATALETFTKKDENGMYVAEVKPIAEITFKGQSGSRKETRAEFKKAGYEIPRGCEIVVDVVESVLYGCTFDEFLSVAKPIVKQN